jgi:hypothetical protein
MVAPLQIVVTPHHGWLIVHGGESFAAGERAMDQLAPGDAIIVRSECAVDGSRSFPTDLVWLGYVREIAGAQVTMIVRTEGGAEMFLQTEAREVQRRANGEWQVILPMKHRVIDLVTI